MGTKHHVCMKHGAKHSPLIIAWSAPKEKFGAMHPEFPKFWVCDLDGFSGISPGSNTGLQNPVVSI